MKITKVSKFIMKFLKENLYNVVRLMINQFGMMIFGLVLSFATANLQGELSGKMFLIVSLFSAIFYLVLIYYMIWELGARDIIRVEAGRQKYDPFYGTKIALIANIPNFFVAFLGLIGYITGYVLSDGGVGVGLFGAAHMLSGFIQAPYLGIVKQLLASLGLSESYLARAVVYFFTTIPSIVVASFAYVLGCKNFRFFPAKNTKKS